MLLRVRNIRHNEGGQALVETALVIPLLIVIMLGAIEVARIAYASIEVANAARAGVAFAAQNRNDAVDTAHITTAATQEAPDLSNVSATSTQACYCSSASSTAVSCSTAATTCAATDHVEVQVTVDVTGKMNTIFGMAGIPSSFTLTSAATMMVEQ